MGKMVMLAAVGNRNRDRPSPLLLYLGSRLAVGKSEVFDRHYETNTPKTGEIDANSSENWGE